MSKKRRTRKQKETARVRHFEEIQPIHIDTPTYSISGIKTESIEKKAVIETGVDGTKDNKSYLTHDILQISAATGIVIAFDILLFVLLNTGVIRLNFLGY